MILSVLCRTLFNNVSFSFTNYPLNKLCFRGYGYIFKTLYLPFLIILIWVLLFLNCGACEMAHWLQMHTALSEDLGLVLSTHITWLRTACNSCSRVPNTLLWSLGHCSHEQKSIHRHMSMHIYNLKQYKNAKTVCMCGASVCV